MRSHTAEEGPLDKYREYSKLLSRIFKSNIEVIKEEKQVNRNEKFYLIRSQDGSISSIFNYYNSASSLSYLSPTRFITKCYLIGLKCAYYLELLRYFNRVQVVCIKGFADLNYYKFGWNGYGKPKLFIAIGTLKDTQNAITFLSSPGDFKECIVVKTAIGPRNNLATEYLVGGAITQNKTNYIEYNKEENFLTQSYIPGYRKITFLTNQHVDFLKKLIVKNKTIQGSLVKRGLRSAIIRSQKLDLDNRNLLHRLVDSINDDFVFGVANRHGDFASYNIVYIRYPNEFSVIDWEDAELDGICLLDLFNYVYMHDCLFVNRENEILERITFKMVCIYFSNSTLLHDVTSINQYKLVFILSEYLKRLTDAGSDDIYVKYLYRMATYEDKKVSNFNSQMA